MIASAHYRAPDTGREAQIVIYSVGAEHVVCTYMTNDLNLSPLWMERGLNETAARQCGNLWHYRLKRNYGMQRVQAADTTQGA